MRLKVVLQGHTVCLWRASGYHNPIGWVHLDAVGQWAYQGQLGNHGVRPTRARAILALVRGWRLWVGLGPGKVEYL